MPLLIDVPIKISPDARDEIAAQIAYILAHYNGNGVILLELRHGQVYRVRCEMGRSFELEKQKPGD